jgi:hypothetical protein
VQFTAWSFGPNTTKYEEQIKMNKRIPVGNGQKAAVTLITFGSERFTKSKKVILSDGDPRYVSFLPPRDLKDNTVNNNCQTCYILVFDIPKTPHSQCRQLKLVSQILDQNKNKQIKIVPISDVHHKGEEIHQKWVKVVEDHQNVVIEAHCSTCKDFLEEFNLLSSSSISTA